MNRRTLIFSIGALALMSGCASRPIEEIIMADVALKAAQKARADSLAQNEYRKAENFYLRAKKDFYDNYFDSSRKNAERAKHLAEEAEYKALLKQIELKGKALEEPSSTPSTEAR